MTVSPAKTSLPRPPRPLAAAPRLLARAAGVAALVFGLMACNTSSNQASPEPPTPKTNDAAKGTSGDAAKPKSPGKDAKAIPDTIYPGLPVALLSPKHRATLVNVTQAQLCPCPSSTQSLHECLQKEDTQCNLARDATMEAMRQINSGLSERDALDALGQYVINAHKVHSFDLSNTPHLGDPKKAKVTVVEFADFECPYCNFARSIVKDVHKTYGDDVVIYFKQYPLGMHANATPAALAALAAHNQGKFWPMYDLLFDNQKSLSEAKILELAQTVGLNMDTFKADWKSEATIKRLNTDKQDGTNANVSATPSFFINGKAHLGEKTADGIKAGVASAMKK